MKKVLVLALVFAFAVLAACQDPTPPSQQPTTQTPPPQTTTDATPGATTTEEPTDEGFVPGTHTLTFRWWGGDARHTAIGNALDLYMSHYPQVTVIPEGVVFDGFLTALQTQLAARTEPDLVQSNYAWVHSLAEGANPFYDHNELGHIIDLSEWGSLLEFTRTTDGQIGGVPHGLTGRAIMYNRAMFAEHGFDTFPSTWDELIEVGRLIAADNSAIDQGENRYAFYPIPDLNFDIMIMQLLYNETGREMDDGANILYTVDEVERVFELIGRLIESGTVPAFEQLEPPNNTQNPLWQQGRAGAAFEWVSMVHTVGDDFNGGDRPGLGLALLPPLTNGGRQDIVQRPSLVHAVTRSASDPEIAAHLLNFLYTNEEALILIGDQLGIPFARSGAMIAEREGIVAGSLLEGLGMLNMNVGVMGPLFEDPNLRPQRFDAINGFWTGVLNARQAAENWVNNQQRELDNMN